MKANITISKTGIVFLLAMLFQLPAFSQSIDSARRQFERYSAQHLQEKVFVHTDKSFYMVGETMWFKVYVTDAIFNRPSDISKISYVEIITKDLKPVLQAKIEINNGSGNGSFVMPSFLATGNYLLRAYTNWMKNIDPEYYFEKKISIVNTAKNPASTSTDSGKLTAAFFPEGGQMVSSLPTTVAFQITNKYGAGTNAQGYLLNRNNDTILQFTPGHFGIGKFNFTPVKGEQYKAVIKAENIPAVTMPLPRAYTEGYVMQVSEPDSGHLRVVVTSNYAAAYTTYLFIHTRGRFKSIVQQDLKNGEAVFVIDKKSLDDGINHLTVFNYNRQPVCERLHFKRPSKKLEIDINVQQSTLSTRTKVDLELTTHQQQSIVADADMSVATFLLDPLQSIDEPDILSYLLLTSDLSIPVESPAWYFNRNNAETTEGIDNLMLTHGWRRFKWEDILSDKKPYFAYLPEVEGPVVTGRVFEKSTGLPANNITTFLSAPGINFQFASAQSNQNGELVFNPGKFYGSNQFIAQTNSLTDSNYRVDINNPFADKFSSHASAPLSLTPNWRQQLQSRSISSQVENVYLKEAKQQFSFPVDADTSHFYGRPDQAYYLDDYTRFTTMEEVMREFVKEVRVRRLSDNYNFKVRRPNSLTYFDSDPLVLLDGVPVFNINKIMAMDPLKIKKLDIVTHKYYIGSYITDGIISYSTYDGDLGGYPLDPNGLVVEYEGLQREREFYSPAYDTPEKLSSRIPDFRNVLYWLPTLKTNETGHQKVSFYTSDLPGKYAVMVQGITPGGLAGSKVITFTIEGK